MSRAKYPLEAVCPLCGPHYGERGHWEPVCPTCHLDAGEVRYRALILEIGGAEVYRREYRAAQATAEGAA